MYVTVAEIKERLKNADESQLAVLERALAADERKGVRDALRVARQQREERQRERDRVTSLYDFERQLVSSHGAVSYCGLDEVGRGSLAGPLAVGAVVLPDAPIIEGLNDSKQIRPHVREEIAEQIKRCALAWTVQYIEPATIDELGMSASLISAFQHAIAALENEGISLDLVLLDGNPLHMDSRELNVVKGDGRCASIAAASIVAKVERDALMTHYAAQYPGYGFAENKGYASAAHIAAIKQFGLSPLHRRSFCHAFVAPEQPSLF